MRAAAAASFYCVGGRGGRSAEENIDSGSETYEPFLSPPLGVGLTVKRSRCQGRVTTVVSPVLKTQNTHSADD